MGANWQLKQLGVDCEVIAPSLVPTKAGDRVKADRRDAEKLGAGCVGGSGMGESAPSQRDRFSSAGAEESELGDEVKKIAWKAQQRLHKHYQAFAARGKNKNQIVTSLGRELLGFIWAIGVHTEQQQKSLGKTA